jgi:hypothetical protein
MRGLRQSACRRYESMKNYARRLKAKATRTGRRSSPHVAERTDAQKDARGKSW